MPTFRHFKTIVKLGYFPRIYKDYSGNQEDIKSRLKISDTTYFKLLEAYKDKLFVNQPSVQTPPTQVFTQSVLDKIDIAFTILNDRIARVEKNPSTASSSIDIIEIKKQIQKLSESAPKEIIIKNIERNETKTSTSILPNEYERILALAQARMNILLVGPAGCGKTHIAKTVSESLELPFYSISVSAGMSESQLAGWLVPTGDGGKFEYRRSSFIKCYEEGGVFLLDEIDAGDSNTLVFINAALANGSCPVPNRTEQPYAKRHKDFICIAAANTYGNGADRQYVGRNQLDAATLDRFRIGIVAMNYDRNVEKALITPEILTWGLKVREVVLFNKMRRIISTRFLRDLSVMNKNFPELYATKKDWSNLLTQDWSEDEKLKVAHLTY